MIVNDIWWSSRFPCITTKMKNRIFIFKGEEIELEKESISEIDDNNNSNT